MCLVTVIRKLEVEHSLQLCALYSKEWWSLRRSPQDVAKMLEHSDLVFGLIDRNCKLAGFIRVLTDFTFKAIILDLIVAESWRGHGLGGMLLDTVMADPSLADIAQFELYCLPELEPFYRKWNFHSTRDSLCFLRRDVMN